MYSSYIPPTGRVCERCGSVPLWHGRQKYCKSCRKIVRKEYMRVYYQTHKDVMNARTKAWVLQNHSKRLEHIRKSKKGRDHEQ